MEKAIVRRVTGRSFFVVALRLGMIMPSSIFAEDLPPFEYVSPENSIPTVPTLQKNGSNNPDSAFFRNVVPAVNPVMDAWRHLSPLNLTDDKAEKIPAMLTGEEVAKMFILNSLSYIRQHLQGIIDARQCYEAAKAKKMPVLNNS